MKWRDLRGMPALAGTAVLPAPQSRPAAVKPTARPLPRPEASSNDKLDDLLGEMRRIDPETLAALTRLLERPQGWPVVRAVGRIDSRLITAVQQLDTIDRDLLMAIVKEMDRE